MSWVNKINLDKTSTVEFYLVDAFEIFHFIPLYDLLRSRGIKADFIAEPPYTNVAGSWFDYNTAISILDNKKLNWRKCANPKAGYAITTQDAVNLCKYGKETKKISFSYGLGFPKNYYMHSKRKVDGFDYLFVHGEYSKAIMSKMMDPERIFVMGFPKHYFAAKVDDNRKKQIKTEIGLDTNKRIIVYMPTWDDDSSVELFKDSISDLRSQYCIVTKAHHCTFRLPELKKQLDDIYELSDVVLPGNYPFENAACLADKFLIDAKSGASTEVAYLNEQADILLLTPREDYNDYFYDDINALFDVINNPKDLADRVSKGDPKKAYRNSNIEYYLGDKYTNYIKKIIPLVFKNL